MKTLLTEVTNGDKIVLEKLDSSVTTSSDNVDDEDYAILVDQRCLVDENPRNLQLLIDLMNLPRKKTCSIISHPVISTFIEDKWIKSRKFFLVFLVLYLAFVLLFSGFLWMMYERNNKEDAVRIPVELPRSCDALKPINSADSGSPDKLKLTQHLLEPIDVRASSQDELSGPRHLEKSPEYKIKLEVIKEKKNRTKLSRVKRNVGLFSECWTHHDVPLCVVELLLVSVIITLLLVETWQALALGREYFKELENWFELIILSLAIATLSLKSQLDSLAIVASIGICLSWIELIFLFGRYPSLGGTFSIMYYSITKERRQNSHSQNRFAALIDYQLIMALLIV